MMVSPDIACTSRSAINYELLNVYTRLIFSLIVESWELETFHFHFSFLSGLLILEELNSFCGSWHIYGSTLAL